MRNKEEYFLLRLAVYLRIQWLNFDKTQVVKPLFSFQKHQILWFCGECTAKCTKNYPYANTARRDDSGQL